MPKTEITKLAEEKLMEITLEIGNFVDTAKVVDEMGRILKHRWLNKGMERILKRLRPNEKSQEQCQRKRKSAQSAGAG